MKGSIRKSSSGPKRQELRLASPGRQRGAWSPTLQSCLECRAMRWSRREPTASFRRQIKVHERTGSGSCRQTVTVVGHQTDMKHNAYKWLKQPEEQDYPAALSY